MRKSVLDFSICCIFSFLGGWSLARLEIVYGLAFILLSIIYNIKSAGTK